MKALLKFGGLTFSAGLTLSLFVRLFGAGAFGLTMALAALALFEIGAAGWAHLLKAARDGQRQIARVCLAVTVALSLLSSCTEIVLATSLGARAFAFVDLEFVTLAMIAAALSANVIGAICFEYAAPETTNKMRELERQAKARKAAHDLEDKVTELAITRAEAEVETVAADVAGRLARGLKEGIVTRLLAAEQRRELPAPTDNGYHPAPSEHAPAFALGGAEVDLGEFPTAQYPAVKVPGRVTTKPSKNGHSKPHTEAEAPKV